MEITEVLEPQVLMETEQVEHQQPLERQEVQQQVEVLVHQDKMEMEPLEPQEVHQPVEVLGHQDLDHRAPQV